MLKRTCALVAMLVVACSADGTAGSADSPVDSSVTSVAETVASETTLVQTSTTEPPTTTSTTVTTEPDEFFPGIGLALLSAEVAGEGPRPRLQWESIPEASEYMVLVLDPQGRPWWSWTGEEPGVVLGGVESEVEIGGPTAVEGATWVVFGLDENGGLVAASPMLSLQR